MTAENWDDAVDHIYTDRIVSLEFAAFFLGDFLGSGISRYVFVNRIDPRFVIKIDVSEYNANATEFQVWNSVRFTAHAKWFAPIKRMSKCARILMMRRAKPIEHTEQCPKKLPAFFADIKRSNFGMIGKQIKCIDYASNLLMEKGMTGKMKQVNWSRL